MNPIKDINEVVNNWNKFEEFEKKKGGLFAFFLYTDEDRTLAGYVREHYRSLHELSGDYCLIFLIDQPSKDPSTYWQDFTFKDVWEGFTRSRPYNKAKAYEIADYFGILPREMPCIVFFKSIYDKDLLVFPLENSWREEDLRTHFREIFTVFRDAEDVDVMDRTEGGIAKKRAALWNVLSSHIRQRRLQAAMRRIVESPVLRTIRDIFVTLARLPTG